MQNQPYYEVEKAISSPVAGGTPHRGGEIRLYEGVKYLLVDMSPCGQLVDSVGCTHMGQGSGGCLVIELAQNEGNKDLANVLRRAAEILDPEGGTR